MHLDIKINDKERPKQHIHRNSKRSIRLSFQRAQQYLLNSSEMEPTIGGEQPLSFFFISKIKSLIKNNCNCQSGGPNMRLG